MTSQTSDHQRPESDPVELEQCPGCDLQLPADDGWAQKAHMEAEHPEIIARRLQAAGL